MTESPGTRAVLRLIKGQPNIDWPKCVACDQFVKFESPQTLKARIRNGEPAHTHQVIANIYVDGVWDRVEHWHQACFEGAGCPVEPYLTDDTKWERSGH